MGTKMTLHLENDLSLTRRLVWGRLFGSCIENVREAGGRSVEQAAHLAGMEASEWAAIEAGLVPEDAAQLQSMAGALECSYDQLVNLALICKGAWGL